MTATRQSKDRFNDYEGFVEKFKPKLTTDDCYTPPAVYECVADWVQREYDISRKRMVRPFYPGGDFESYDYPDDCVVVDNPPFSIITPICRWYADRGIPFFLFAPHLTNFSTRDPRVNHIIVGTHVIYANGAKVPTSFLTNLGSDYIRTASGLAAELDAVVASIREDTSPSFPKYKYPPELLTISMLVKLVKHGIDYRVSAADCMRVAQLDDQKFIKKGIYGSGYLLNEKAAAEKAAAEKAAAEKAAAEKAAAEKKTVIRFGLSERERKLLASLGR